MKAIFTDIQKKLAEISELKYIDKDWGQLKYEQAPVKFPCALIDIETANFSQLGQQHQLADAQISITVANYRLTPSSKSAPRRDESYAIFDILDEIHQILHGYSNGQIQPLIRTNINKVECSANYEIYKITYRTGWKDAKNREYELVNAKLKIES